MYQRMLNKSVEPSEQEIKSYIGEQGFLRLMRLKEVLNEQYELRLEVRFPFGGSYGWGYKFSHKAVHLFYAFFEEGAFTVTIQLGDACVEAVERALDSLSPMVRELWANRYPCGEQGGWIHYRILSDEAAADVVKLTNIKKRPKQ